MPDTTPVSYAIVPWVRRGLASLVSGAAAKYYASLPVSIGLNGTAVSAPNVQLLGPGDITALDSRAIIRIDPRDSADAFEPNYLATVEFALPDLPWMFTPSGVSNGRLQPWICLIVIPDVAGATIEGGLGGTTVLKIDAPLDPKSELPDLASIDSWAHAQVIGGGLSGAALDAAIDGDPAMTFSRLIAPRKLEASKGYIACVVPTYRAGVHAGLGVPVDDTDLGPAWDATVAAPFLLPVYFYTRFRTGPGGDFASLARKITPAVASVSAGTRTIDVGEPGFGAPAAPGIRLGLEGALRTAGNTRTPWPAGTQAPYEATLRTALNPPAGPGPVVAPPTYGRAQSGAGVPPAGAKPLWLGDLNLDPRARMAASAGTQVIQSEREALVASTWDQLGEIRKANALLRRAQLARETSASLSDRHLATIDVDGTYLQVTAPVHGRISVNLGGTNATLRGHIESSLLPIGAVSSALRKLTRPRGPFGRQFAAGAASIVGRLNTPASPGGASLQIVAPLAAPRGMIAFDDVAVNVRFAKLLDVPARAISGWSVVTSASTEHDVGTLGHTGAFGPVPADVDFSKSPDLPDIFKGAGAHVPPIFTLPTEASELAAVDQQFRAAATAVGAYLNVTATTPVVPAALGGTAGLASVRSQVAGRIDPRATIAARTRARVTLGNGTDPLQPIRTGLSFPQAMYAPLADLSPEWILPGYSTIPLDCATMLIPNAPFVEAYMVGLNEELSRELLWRGFPADTQSTYFQYFWGAAAPDIASIEGFDPAGHLGEHVTDHASGTHIVLLVRASIFRRYPNAVVSAIQAKWTGNVRTLTNIRQYPAFRGDIGSDVTFFGFDIADPRGSDDPAKGRPGWYFVIEEHITEPRFGLEPEASPTQSSVWNDLSWKDVALTGAFLNPAVPPPVPTRESVTWGQNSATLAFVLLRRPVRIAMHAIALLGVPSTTSST